MMSKCTRKCRQKTNPYTRICGKTFNGAITKNNEKEGIRLLDFAELIVLGPEFREIQSPVPWRDFSREVNSIPQSADHLVEGFNLEFCSVNVVRGLIRQGWNAWNSVKQVNLFFHVYTRSINILDPRSLCCSLALLHPILTSVPASKPQNSYTEHIIAYHGPHSRRNTMQHCKRVSGKWVAKCTYEGVYIIRCEMARRESYHARNAFISCILPCKAPDHYRTEALLGQSNTLAFRVQCLTLQCGEYFAPVSSLGSLQN